MRLPNIRQLFTDLGRKFGQLHPAWYGLIYILTSFVFASIYELMPRSFYEPNIKIEISFGEDADTAKKALAQDLETMFQHNNGTNFKYTVKDDDGSERVLEPMWRSIGGGFFCDNFDVPDANTITARCGLPLVDYDPQHIPNLDKREFAGFLITLRLDPELAKLWDPNDRTRFGPNRTYDLSRIIKIDDFPESKASRSLKDWMFSQARTNNIRHGEWFTLRSETMERIMRLLFSGRGFTSYLSNNYWRMWYFSTVTITTLGFGDILPITTPARLLVSIEAIIGLVLIGLFLNSIAHRIASASRSSGQTGS